MNLLGISDSIIRNEWVQKSPCRNKEKWFIQSHTTVGSYGILDFWDGRLHGQSKS